MNESKNIPTSKNGNDKLPVLSVQVNANTKEYFDEFCNKYAYKTLSNGIIAHLRVAMHIYLTNEKEFFKLVAESSNITVSA